jgi:class 3 adenylate cyclase
VKGSTSDQEDTNMRVDRCFAFIDLCGFTAYTEENGDEEAVLLLAGFRTSLREAAARRGVRIVKWLGDGAMLSSTMPDAVIALVVETDHQLERTSATLSLRAGMDVGPVIMFEGDDYIGRPVNVAARLCDVAGPRKLLATDAVTLERPEWVSTSPAGVFEVKGFSNGINTALLGLVPSNGDAVHDPICGLPVPRGSSIRGGRGERFCSEACAGARR